MKMKYSVVAIKCAEACLKVVYFFTTIAFIHLFGSCNSDDVLVTENKRMAVFATVLDSKNVALPDIPVNVTTNAFEDYNILGASRSKAGGSVDFVSLVSYNRGVAINFNPVSSAVYNPNFITVSYIDPREIVDREQRIDLDVVKLSRVQDVNVSISLLSQTSNLIVKIQYYKSTQSFALNQNIDPLLIPENITSNYLKLDEENPTFENSWKLPVGSPIKFFYKIEDEIQKDTTITVNATTNSIDLEF